MKKTVEIYQKKIYNNIGSSERGGQDAGIAQSVEHFTRNEGVVSSSLISGFFLFVTFQMWRCRQKICIIQGGSSRGRTLFFYYIEAGGNEDETFRRNSKAL